MVKRTRVLHEYKCQLQTRANTRSVTDGQTVTDKAKVIVPVWFCRKIKKSKNKKQQQKNRKETKSETSWGQDQVISLSNQVSNDSYILFDGSKKCIKAIYM